tara:strand:+ start:772 stop:975 length:204 start_codon:yes stop_codon:yes gene_type:complete
MKKYNSKGFLGFTVIHTYPNIDDYTTKTKARKIRDSIFEKLQLMSDEDLVQVVELGDTYECWISNRK